MQSFLNRAKIDFGRIVVIKRLWYSAVVVIVCYSVREGKIEDHKFDIKKLLQTDINVDYVRYSNKDKDKKKDKKDKKNKKGKSLEGLSDYDKSLYLGCPFHIEEVKNPIMGESLAYSYDQCIAALKCSKAEGMIAQ